MGTQEDSGHLQKTTAEHGHAADGLETHGNMNIHQKTLQIRNFKRLNIPSFIIIIFLGDNYHIISMFCVFIIRVLDKEN